MAATITYTAKADSHFFSISELNALFTQIKTVLDAKLDVRGDVVEADLRCVDTTIINVPPPVAVGDLLRNE